MRGQQSAAALSQLPPSQAQPAAPERLAITRDPLRIALFILTIITVSRVHQHYPLLAKMRPALLLSLAAAGYAWVHPRLLTRSNIFKLWPMRRMAVLGVLACGSAVFGISLGNSGKWILDNYSKTLLYAFLLILSIRTVRDLYTYVWAYVISAGILSYFATFVFKLSKDSGSAVTRLSDLYTYDANDIGVVLIVGLAFTLLLLHVTRGPRRLGLLVILAGIVVSVGRSGSRGAFLGFLALAIAGLLVVDSMSSARKLVLVLTTALGFAIATPPGYWAQMHTIAAPEGDYNLTTTDGRKQVALRGVGYAMTYPIFGVGIGNFGKAECTLSAYKAEARGHLRCGAPHNSFVQAAAEIGLPGFLVWTSMLFTGITTMVKLRRRLPYSWKTGSDVERFMYSATQFNVLAIVGFAVTAFFLSFAFMDIYYILAVFVAAVPVVINAYLAEHALPLAAADQAGSRGPKRSRGPRGWRVVQSAARAAMFAAPRE